MQLSHTRPVTSTAFDDPNLVAAAGLVPLIKLAQTAGLTKLAQDWLTVRTDKGANAGVRVTSLVAGMAAGADSIDDMAVLRHGGMRRVFTHAPTPTSVRQPDQAVPHQPIGGSRLKSPKTPRARLPG